MIVFLGSSRLDAFRLLTSTQCPHSHLMSESLPAWHSCSRPRRRAHHSQSFCSHLDIHTTQTHAQKINTRRLTLDAFTFMIFLTLDASLMIMNRPRLMPITFSYHHCYRCLSTLSIRSLQNFWGNSGFKLGVLTLPTATGSFSIACLLASCIHTHHSILPHSSHVSSAFSGRAALSCIYIYSSSLIPHILHFQHPAFTLHRILLIAHSRVHISMYPSLSLLCSF